MDTHQQELLRLVEQSQWANRRWVDFVYSQPDPEARPRELLAHIMAGERIWFARVSGQENISTDVPLMTKDELTAGFAENAETFRQLISSRLAEVIHFKRASGEEYHSRVEDVIQHLLTHGYHHRGQLAAHYARSGMKYPSTDHIDYLIQNRL